MDAKRIRRENGANWQTRRSVLRGVGGATALGLAGCLGDDGDGASVDPDSTDDGDDPSTSPTQSTGDGTAPVDVRVFPPNHNRDAFSSLSIVYESFALTTTGGEVVTVPVDQTVGLTDGSTATGVPVAENLAVPAGEYEIIEVHYSIEQAVTTDGQTVEIEFTSPESENVVELHDRPSTIEESSPYVLQAHFALFSEPWSLSIPTIVLGPGIPD
jgi:hypothetical protein